ncbi:TRAP transporter substrate-binding protein [Pokkaliibacter sp. CJK22405]|uniref:TRAP transporter substrate-binding protein n=1 Tax=Pokkaliibacter sp. CJK22405 TaxID=3384615 RepID=UPI003984E9CD
MNKNAKRLLANLSSCLFVGTLLAGAVQAHATTLRLAHTFNPGEASYEVLAKLSKTVAEKSDGDLKIQVFPSEQLGSEVQLLQQAKNGSVDIVVPGYSGASTLLPGLEISNAPFMFKDWKEAKYVIESDAYQPMFDQLEKQDNLIPLSKTWYWGWRNFTFKGHDVHSVADMKGLKVRVPESPIWVEMIKSFGASPAPIPFSEVYLALQQGTVDGQENPTPTIYSRKFYEVQDELVVSHHMLQSQVVLMNAQRWKSLTDKERDILTQAFKDAAEENYQLQTSREDKMLDELKQGGKIKVVTDIDRDSFEKAAASAREKLIDRWGSDNYQRVMQKIEAYRQQ